MPDYGGLAGDASQMAQSMETVKAQYDQLVEQRNQLIALGIDITLSGDELETNISSVKATLQDTDKQLSDGIATIQEQIDKTPEQMETIQKGKDACCTGQIPDYRGQSPVKCGKRTAGSSSEKDDRWTEPAVRCAE